MQNYTVIDLESGPLPDSELAQFKPEFHADARLKDIAKIQANILEKEQAWKEDLALSALTGKVLCIGQLIGSEFYGRSADQHEKEALDLFWQDCASWIHAGQNLVGFFCRTFDVPFLIRRSWALGIKPPMCLWNGRYLSDQIIDVAERWACGSRDPRDRISLDNLSKHLGTGAKNGDGANFAQLWATDRPKALEYLKQDLTLTKLAYERLYL